MNSFFSLKKWAKNSFVSSKKRIFAARIMESSLRKTHNVIKCYGTDKSVHHRRLLVARILLR